jgi:heme-degrading monooxygenase HmoA
VIANTPEPPYTAVIFTSLRTNGDNGYGTMAERMEELAAQQPGYLGIESSYWVDDASARAWKQIGEHLVAQRTGQERWYSDYRVRVARVERDYGPPA